MLTRAPLDLAALIADRRQGHSLAAPFYRSQEVFDLDLEAIFGRHWIYACTVADVREPGDVFRFDVGANSVLIMRDDDGGISAVHNVCRHRGARLVETERATVGKLVCPYHQWTYELNGDLFHAEKMGPDFDHACHGLKKVHLRNVSGLLFVCFAAEAPDDIAELEAVMAPRLAPFDLARTKIAAEADLIEEGNWKLVMENNRECYHCAGNHPELCVSISEYTFGFEPTDAAGLGLDGAAEYAASVEKQVADWEAAGFPSSRVEKLSGRATGFRTERVVLAGEGESQSPDTRIACKKLLGDITEKKLGGLHLWTQPNSWHHFMSDHIVTFTAVPLTPDRTLVKTRWLVHEDAVEGVDYDVDHLTFTWNATNAQDAALVKLTQLGASSPAYEPGPYSPVNEGLVEEFQVWYVERLKAFMAK